VKVLLFVQVCIALREVLKMHKNRCHSLRASRGACQITN
jgi:hypothetical protein